MSQPLVSGKDWDYKPVSREAPEPIRGGTFFYCPWAERIPRGAVSCGAGHVGWATGTRFRTARAFRRHWRRFHSE